MFRRNELSDRAAEWFTDIFCFDITDRNISFGDDIAGGSAGDSCWFISDHQIGGKAFDQVLEVASVAVFC